MAYTTLTPPSDLEISLRAIAASSWISQPARDAISLIQDKQFDKALSALCEANKTAKSQREKACLKALQRIAIAESDNTAPQHPPHSGISNYLCN